MHMGAKGSSSEELIYPCPNCPQGNETFHSNSNEDNLLGLLSSIPSNVFLRVRNVGGGWGDSLFPLTQPAMVFGSASRNTLGLGPNRMPAVYIMCIMSRLKGSSEQNQAANLKQNDISSPGFRKPDLLHTSEQLLPCLYGLRCRDELFPFFLVCVNKSIFLNTK